MIFYIYPLNDFEQVKSKIFRFGKVRFVFFRLKACKKRDVACVAKVVRFLKLVIILSLTIKNL